MGREDGYAPQREWSDSRLAAERVTTIERSRGGISAARERLPPLVR
jgi:hypothetical protein